MINYFVNPYFAYYVLPSHCLNPSASMGRLPLFKAQKQQPVWRRWDSTYHCLFLTASLILTYRTEQCTILMV